MLTGGSGWLSWVAGSLVLSRWLVGRQYPPRGAPRGPIAGPQTGAVTVGFSGLPPGVYVMMLSVVLLFCCFLMLMLYIYYIYIYDDDCIC